MQAFAPTTVHSGQTQTLVLFTGAKSAQTSRTKVRNARQRKLQCHASLEREGSASVKEKKERDFGLGDILGPIGLTLGGSLNKKVRFILIDKYGNGLDLGPIALSFGGSTNESRGRLTAAFAGEESYAEASTSGLQSIHSMKTEEWQQKFEADGYVDLWVEEEFNAGSRLVGGRSVHKGGVAGYQSGEGPSAGVATRHHVTIHNHHAGQVVEVDVPEDRYVLWEAEDRGLLLPYACRMGCCTACAVRIKEGEMYQPQSLGISAELREAGYGLMCVGYPRSDLVLETVEEDEVYDMQFGRSFAEQAVDPNNPDSIERDDWALEIANMDE
ncbi:hypothetical protein COCSUDRAFT_18627 [Coccomyxa subellipsoidea C-169]|uniref:2Fe-2S ferredoxin-type domain-containing protein n=1 Tax=Coccomyxa subellipsoidea (strain C-169) TaxID=574566 RepID=I0YQ71_COCSC|nr:hypothetical protein COCSUDRAFT_18627 [Coccomyxa subellipsoidea C-169]EIE20540.1 hypothetical protein COCSUDRAFT_18627 [Coccomyxa subellipsoidea C-169]|eukprot:XP_005645084.1 hypothetical protein COCSUDRAFT_18627 [Coccomyxa subellipsoidea C-169]